jgi:hypothetical protein
MFDSLKRKKRAAGDTAAAAADTPTKTKSAVKEIPKTKDNENKENANPKAGVLATESTHTKADTKADIKDKNNIAVMKADAPTETRDINGSKESKESKEAKVVTATTATATTVESTADSPVRGFDISSEPSTPSIYSETREIELAEETWTPGTNASKRDTFGGPINAPLERVGGSGNDTPTAANDANKTEYLSTANGNGSTTTVTAIAAPVPTLAITKPSQENLRLASPALPMPGGPPVNVHTDENGEWDLERELERPNLMRTSRSYKTQPVFVTSYDRPIDDVPAHPAVQRTKSTKSTKSVKSVKLVEKESSDSDTVVPSAVVVNGQANDHSNGQVNGQVNGQATRAATANTTSNGTANVFFPPIVLPGPPPTQTVVQRTGHGVDDDDEDHYERLRTAFYNVPDPTRPETTQTYAEEIAHPYGSDGEVHTPVQQHNRAAAVGAGAAGAALGAAAVGAASPSPAPRQRPQSAMAAPIPVVVHSHSHTHSTGVQRARSTNSRRSSEVPQRLPRMREDGVFVGDIVPLHRQQQLQTTGNGIHTPPRHQLHDPGVVPAAVGASAALAAGAGVAAWSAGGAPPRRRHSSFGYRPQPQFETSPQRDSAAFFAPDHRASLYRSNTVHSRAATLGRNGTLSRASNGGTVGRRAGAFGMGAGLSVGTQPEEVLGRADIHSRAEVSERELPDEELRRLARMEKKEAKKLEKLMKGEERAQGKAVEAAIRDLRNLATMQKEAIAHERKSQQKLGRATGREHKARMRFLKEKERYEKFEADLQQAENDFEERRDHAAGLTAQIAERTQEIDDLRAQKAADDRERRVKKQAMRNPAYA